MKTMKVALLSSGLVSVPPIKGGAVEEYVFQLAKHLGSFGIDAIVLDRVFANDKSAAVKHIRRIESPRVPSHVPRRDILQELSFGFASSKEIRKFDLVHANTAWVGIAAIAGFRGVSTRFVYTCHNPLWPTESVRSSEKIVRKVESYIMKRSDAVIGLNNTMAKALHEKAHLPSEKIHLAPNGVDTSFFIPNVSDALVERKYDLHAKRVILFVGKVAPVKGVHILLRAFKVLLEKYRHIDLKLCIVGPLSGGFTRETIGSYAQGMIGWAQRQLPHDSYVFTGAVSREELRKLYSRADVFVLPSLAEAFALVLLEAMSSGCPVVGSDSGGIVDVVQDGTNGYLFRSNSFVDLAERLNILLTNENLRKSMATRSRKIVEEVYDWKAIARNLSLLYAGLLST